MSDLLHWWLECEPDGCITLRGIRYVQDEDGEEEELSIDNSFAFTVDVARSAQACFDNGITLFDEDTQPLAVVEGGEEIKCCHFEPDLCLGLDIMPYFLGWNELFDAVLDTDPTRRQRVLQQAAVQSVTHVAADRLREKVAEQREEARKQEEAEEAARRQAEAEGGDQDQQDETQDASRQSAHVGADHGARSSADQSIESTGASSMIFFAVIAIGAVISIILGHPVSPLLAAVSIASGIVSWLANVSEKADQAARRSNAAAEASRSHPRAGLRQCQTNHNDAAIRRRAATAAGRSRGGDASDEAPAEGSESLFSDDEDN